MADPKVKVDVIADDTQAVQQLGKTLRNLQQAAEALSKSLTSVTTSSQKYDAAMSKAALSNEKLAQASAKTALSQQKLATEAERTAAAHSRAEAATARATATTMRAETAQLRAATAHQKAEVAAQKQADAQQKLEQKTNTVKQAFDTFATTLRNVTLVAGVLGTTFKQAFDFAKEGAQITQTATAFDYFATSIIGIPNLLQQLKDGADGTITEFELMSNTLTLVAGTTQETGRLLAAASPQLLEIARAAQVLNPALGDVTYFYESLNTGIKRLERRWLDNLGLVVKAQDAYKAHAAALGKSTLALTAEEKTQAFLNETLRVGQLLIEQVGGSVQSAVDPWSRLEVKVSEFTNTLKQGLADGLLPYVQFLTGDFQAKLGAVEALNRGTALSIEELAAAYEDAHNRMLAVAAVGDLAGPFFNVDQVENDLRRIEQELAIAAGSYEEYARIVGQSAGAGVTGEAVAGSEEEQRARYERLIAGIEGATKAQDYQKLSLSNYLTTQQEHIDLTEEQLEALAKLKEAWADAAVATLKNAGDLNEFGTAFLTAADSADLVAGQIFRLAGALGILSDEELEAAQNTYAFQQVQAKLLDEFKRTGDVQAYTQAIRQAAQRLGIEYLTAAQQATLNTNLLIQAANFGAGSLIRFGQGLGIAALQALKLKKANDAASQSVQRLATVSAGAASAFINALEGGASGGGGGVSAIDAAAEAQQEWNAAFAQSFMQLLDAKEPIENWNTELLKSAAAAGASAETLALLAAATGEYSQEQIAAALQGAAMKQAIEEISAALVDGRATSDQALAALTGFQEQLAQGGDFKFNIEDFGIAPLQEAIAGAGGGAGGAAEATKNWTDELLKLADQGHLTAGDMVALALATGKYSEAQVTAALKTLLMQQKLEELSQQIGKRPIQDIIADLKEFEGQLDKQLVLGLDTLGAEEAIDSVATAVARLPTDVTINIHVKADPIPDLTNIPGAQNPLSGSQVADQHGGPLAGQHGIGLAGTTLVGEVRPELVVGGQVIPRIPPGFFMDQAGFADSVAAALSGSMVAPPSYNNTVNINRSNTVQNNQKSIVINNATGAAASQSTRRELGAF